MSKESFRIEWRETPEQGETSVALARAARRSLRSTLAFLGIASLAFLAPSWWAAAGIALPFLFIAYVSGTAYWRNRVRVDRRKVRTWIEARAKPMDGFREPAREAKEGRPALFTIDRDGIELSIASLGVIARPWCAVRSFRVLREGHVLFLTRGRPGVFLPAWAFESEAQRAMLLEHARAWRSMAPRPKAPEDAPPIAGDDMFEVGQPLTLAIARRALQPLSLTAYIVIAVSAYGFGATYAALLMRPAFFSWAMIVGALVGSSPWSRAGISLLLQRRHVVHRLRFSSIGASWASALGSETRPWKSVPVQRHERSTVLFGVTIPDNEIESARRDTILRWSGARAPAAKPKSSYRMLFLSVLTVLGFLASHQLAENDAPPARKQIVEERYARLPPPPREPPICDLPPLSLPGRVLPDDPESCEDLARQLSRDSSAMVIERCAVIGNGNVDRAAIVSGRRASTLWLRIRQRWLPAQEMPIHSGPRAIATIPAPGGSFMILASAEGRAIADQRIRGPAPVLEARFRTLAACELHGGRPSCALVETARTLLLQDAFSARNADCCARRWYEVQVHDNALRFTFHSQIPPAARDLLADVNTMPRSEYTIEELGLPNGHL